MMVRVGVIGAGHWGPHLIRNFDNRRTSVVAWVADRDPDRLAQVRARFPDVQVTEDAGAVIADPGVDAIVVATPTTTHHALAKQALDAGKHVLVEKPLATTVADAEELDALAKQAGLVLMVGHVFLYNDGVRWVKDFIDTGKAGRIYYIGMVRTNLGPIRMDVNAAWDLAAHDISIANHWLEATPVGVAARGGNWINPGVDDAVFAVLRYPNDVLVHLHASWLNPRKARDITVVGERAMLTFDDMNPSEPVRIYDKGVADERTTPTFTDTITSFRASIREGDITIPKFGMGEPLRAECDHFLACITDDATPLTGGADGIGVVRVLDAMDRSVGDGGREVTVS